MKYTLIFTLSIFSLWACSGESKSGDEEKLQNIPTEDKATVSVAVVHSAIFNDEIVSNGKVAAGKYADVYWEVDGVLASVLVVNGQNVTKGTTLAQMETFRHKNALESAKAEMERTRLAMQEIIIGQGMDPETDSIPEKVIHLAEVKSGFLQSNASYLSALYDYEHCVLKAPIDGVVANISDKPSNRANRSAAFCRIIDMNSFTAEFSIIENELPMVEIGNEVVIRAFAKPEKTWGGTITEINPYIENNGMVKVKAKIRNATGLYEGTNISVRIRREAGVHKAVPKGAVVLRSGRPVVFKAVKGKAQWVYVETTKENSESVAIVCEDIQEGDTIVVSGNTFLAHNSEIIY